MRTSRPTALGSEVSMGIAEKIEYTWLIIALFCFLTAWLIDEDEHPKLLRAVLTIAFMPIAIGLVGLVIYALYAIWK